VTVLPCAENILRESRQEATESFRSLSLSKLTIIGMAGTIKGRILATFVMSKARTRNLLNLPCCERFDKVVMMIQ
jgi:CheY-specific phosphatase CheX